MKPTQVREGIKKNLSSIKGLRSYDIMPDLPQPPCAVIGQLDFTFDLNNSRGLDQANLDVYVLVQRFSERTGSGDFSIKAAIESDLTLGGACNALRVTSAESGTYLAGDVEFLSYRYRLTIWGQGE